MSRLLSTNFMRLWKDKVFWISIAIMASSALYKTTRLLIHNPEPWEATLSNIFFHYTIYIIILAAVFCSLFIGTEFSDGTIRNKLIMGYNRQNIYCANLIVSIGAGLFMCITHIVVSLIGVSMGFTVSVYDTIIGVLCSFALVCSTTALFNMITMISNRKTIGAVICIVLAFLLLLFAYDIRNKVSLARSSGEVSIIYEFLYAFLPSCQALQLDLEPEMYNVTNPILRIIYAFILFALSTSIGLILFKRKDLE